jgi:SAM-dependent methyltransferase
MTDDTRSAAIDHFATLVPWFELGPPLRPAPADVAAFQRVIDVRVPERAVLLGLTPEIALCSWPRGSELALLDHSQEMISLLWPTGRGHEGMRTVVGDWCSMPFPSASVDLVLGDGCLTLLTHDGWRRLASEVRRVLSPGGIFALRVFLCPDEREPLDAIAEDLALGKIGSIDALKLRLFAAVHGPEGALLDDVWHAWSRMRREPGPGFSAAAIAGVERYRGSSSRYFLATAAEARAILGGPLRVIEWQVPSGYELSERCPTVVFGA